MARLKLLPARAKFSARPVCAPLYLSPWRSSLPLLGFPFRTAPPRLTPSTSPTRQASCSPLRSAQLPLSVPSRDAPWRLACSGSEAGRPVCSTVSCHKTPTPSSPAVPRMSCLLWSALVVGIVDCRFRQ
ncbi:uncharacterized protein LOC100193017 [Zea mays]|uniref:Uncharacterized protein n=1 Tax=Zea mays TaxID=4577 RepID=B4FDI0_MAIZE|nr:uncharacterized protein LOC100193017 [Zea mays]ACF80173.1 unknown [Zea mays]|eukprot:NP_001131657.1 uncharacterized protein LOC100193017 [Zea mays]